MSNYDKSYDDIKSLLHKIRTVQLQESTKKTASLLNENDEMVRTEPEQVENKEGDELTFDNINTIGYLSKSEDAQLSDESRAEFTKAVGGFIEATGLMLPYANIRLENGRVIITADVVKNPTLDGVKEIIIDTNEEDPKINLIGGTLILNQDLLNLLNTISRSYNDPQIGRNNLVKATQSKQTQAPQQ
jgi:biotin synthase-like enzyme